MTFNLKAINTTLMIKKHDTQHRQHIVSGIIMLSVIVINVINPECNVLCYAECRCAESICAECHGSRKMRLQILTINIGVFYVRPLARQPY